MMELYEKYFIIKETLTPACHASTLYTKKNGEDVYKRQG